MPWKEQYGQAIRKRPGPAASDHSRSVAKRLRTLLVRAVVNSSKVRGGPIKP